MDVLPDRVSRLGPNMETLSSKKERIADYFPVNQHQNLTWYCQSPAWMSPPKIQRKVTSLKAPAEGGEGEPVPESIMDAGKAISTKWIKGQEKENQGGIRRRARSMSPHSTSYYPFKPVKSVNYR